VRLHSSLVYRTPEEFVASAAARMPEIHEPVLVQASSRNFPLKLSMKAFCVGLSRSMKCSATWF